MSETRGLSILKLTFTYRYLDNETKTQRSSSFADKLLVGEQPMSKRMSYTKIENAILHDFRNKVNIAESTEDMKKFFVYSAQELFNNVFSGKMTFDFDDISLLADREPHYQLSERLLSSDDFNTVWNSSDLPQIIGRLAKTAAKHYIRLEKNPGRTEAKIRR